MKPNIFPGWLQVAVCLVLMVIATGSILSSFSVLAAPLAEEFSTSRMVVMLPMTLVAAASVLVSRWFIKRRGAALGIAAAGISLGGIIMPLLIQSLLSNFEWRVALRYHSALLLICSIPLVYLVVINKPSDRGYYPDNSVDSDKISKEQESKEKISIKAILKDSTFWMIAIAVGVILFGNKGVITNMVPLAIDAGTPVEHAALLISFFSAASSSAKLLFASIADRFDPRLTMCLSLILFLIGLLCFRFAEHGYWIIITGSLSLGLASGGMIPLEGFLIAKSFGHKIVGRVMGMMQFATMPLALLATPLFGYIFDSRGSYSSAYTFFSALAVGAIFLLPKIRIQSKKMIKENEENV